MGFNPSILNEVSSLNCRENNESCLATAIYPSPTAIMSDFDGDFSDELAELAGLDENEKKRKSHKSKGSAAKRRKQE